MLDLNAAMDAIGARLLTIAGMRVYDYTADQVAPPAGVVGLPEVGYDVTKARGTDRAVYPLIVLVSKVSDRASRDVLSQYLAGAGAKSVKAAVDGTLGGVVQHARVASASPATITVAGVDYLAATFQIEVNQ
jgi:hypothetical protein